MNLDGGKFLWQNEMNQFQKSWSKLVTGSKDSVDGTKMSYDELNK